MNKPLAVFLSAIWPIWVPFVIAFNAFYLVAKEVYEDFRR